MPVARTDQTNRRNKGNKTGRKPGRHVTVADKEAMNRVFSETGSISETARRLGWHYGTVWKHIHGMKDHGGSPGWVQEDFVAAVNLPPPRSWDELNPQERGWLTNFSEFRREFFGRDTPPFQDEISTKIAKREESKLLVLCPPGHGKSQCFSIDYPIWEMCRYRAMGMSYACLLISKSDNMAKAFLSQIKQELERNNKLQKHFGRFKPEYPDVWKQDAITVDLLEGTKARKEPTFIAAGAGSHIYGWRVNLIIADDIVDTKNSNTPEAAEKLLIWFSDELISRLEPEGTICTVGTRFTSYDLYGKLWKQRDDNDDPIWFPIIYRAHDDGRCSGEHCMVCKERCLHDKPWPDGCVLWPARFGYRKLRSLRSGQHTSSRFEFIYNQVELPEDDALVKPDWIEKCKNTSRTTWMVPRNSRVMCTLDPSPTEWAVAQCWAYVEQEDKSYLIAQVRRRRMAAPEYLALMRQWTVKLRSMGHDPIWVVEINAAQRWLLQSTEYQQMRLELGLTMIPHTTHRNKVDPQYGVQSLGPAFEYERIDLPWGDPESRREVQPFIDELLVYPSGETDDTVLASWFHLFHIKRLRMPMDGQWFDVPDMPPYLMERRAIVDMRTGDTRKMVYNS